MGPKPDARSILDFLRELRDNNSRDWFEANRPRYEASRADFLSIVGDLLGRFDAVDDLGGIALKDCVFCINRDLRFSKDKTPMSTLQLYEIRSAIAEDARPLKASSLMPARLSRRWDATRVSSTPPCGHEARPVRIPNRSLV